MVQYKFTDFEFVQLSIKGTAVYHCTYQYLEIRKNENLTNTGPRYEMGKITCVIQIVWSICGLLVSHDKR